MRESTWAWLRRCDPRAVWRSPRMLVVRIAWQLNKPLSLIAIAAVLATALLPVAFTLTSGAVVGAVPAAVSTGLDSPSGDHLERMLLLLGAVFVAQLGLIPLLNVATATLSRRVSIHFTNRTATAVLAPPGIGHLEDPNVQDNIARAEGIWGTPPGNALQGLTSLWALRLGGVGGFVIVARYRWWLAIVLVVLSMMDHGFMRKLYDNVTTAIFDRGDIHRRTNWFRDAAIIPGPAKEVRVFGLPDWLLERHHDNWTTAMATVWPAMQGRPILHSALMMRRPLAVAAGLGLLVRSGLSGEISLAELVVFAQGIIQLQSIGASGDVDYAISQGVAAIPPALELEEHLRRDEFLLPGERSAEGLPRDSIRFEGVQFRYRGRTDDVFAGLDLEIPAGRSLAIVGENGAGKTTLVKLLARLYDPDEGRITIDGVDLQDYDPGGWQRRIAAIFQDFQKYDLSARDNVAFGAPRLTPSDELLDRAAARAGATEVLERFPAKWDTPLSRQLTGGTDLSGGEWQRLALARALYAVEGGASVLVLDEPTANLDARAEAELYERFLEVTAGLTTIVISHRFSTVRRADDIVVLAEGKVVERGAHAELVALGGRYARMFQLQAARYVDAAEAGHAVTGAPGGADA